MGHYTIMWWRESEERINRELGMALAARDKAQADVDRAWGEQMNLLRQRLEALRYNANRASSPRENK